MWLHDDYIPKTFANLGTLSYGSVFSPASVEKAGGDINTTASRPLDIVTSGPWRMTEFIKGERITYEPWRGFPDVEEWYVKPVQALDKAVLLSFGDPTSLRLALEKGEIDIAWKDMTKGDLVALQENPDITVELKPSGYTRWMGFKIDEPPFDDVRVRKAVALTIDNKEPVEKILHNIVEPIDVMAPSTVKYNSDIFAELYRSGTKEERIAEAKQLLTDAGYPDGFSVELIYTDRFEVKDLERQVCTIFKQQLAEIGIDLEIRYVDFPSWYQMHNARSVTMGTVGWKLDVWDVDNMFSAVIRSGGIYSVWMGVNDTKFDELFYLQQELWGPVEDDPGREAVIKEIHKKIAEDVIYIPLWQAVEYTAYRNHVKNYHTPWTFYWQSTWDIEKEIPSDWETRDPPF
jgi:peptide/nickel transport system substrate-binding protein